MINGVQEGGEVYLSQNFRLPVSYEDLLSDDLEPRAVDINDVLCFELVCIVAPRFPVALINNHLIMSHMMWSSEEPVYAVASLSPAASVPGKAGMSTTRRRANAQGSVWVQPLTLCQALPLGKLSLW